MTSSFPEISMSIHRLSHIRLLQPDTQLCTTYYINILGKSNIKLYLGCCFFTLSLCFYQKYKFLTFSSLVVDSGWGKGLSWWVVSTTEGSSILLLMMGVARGDKSRGI